MPVSARRALAIVVVGLAGCSPALPIAIALPSCATDAELALVVEEAPCTERAPNIAWSGPIDEGPDPLAPGSYCIDALAYRTGTERHGHRCRIDALARENRRLPRDREAVELAPSCAIEPTDLGDDLLREVAGCSGACDVERCICSLGCEDGPSAACPPPIEVERVVMGDDYACGLAPDHQSFTCWGDGSAAIERIRGWTAYEAGVAATGLAVVPSEQRIVLFDGDSETFCDRTDLGTARCGTMATTDGAEFRRLTAVGRGFVCGGEVAIACGSAEGRALPLRATDDDFPYPSRISAGHDYLCGIVSGAIHCTTPMGTPDSCEADCPWHFTSCVREGLVTSCTPSEIVAETIALRTRILSPQWIDLDLGWDRACAIDTARRVSCWSVDPADPIGLGPPSRTTQTLGGVSRDVRVPLVVVDLSAQEISVGAEHLCTRRDDGVVVCGRLEMRGTSLLYVDVEPFPEGGNIVSFVAGPSGISCAVRSVEGGANRVECFQLAGFRGREGLLGRAHTREDAGPDGLSVCP